MATFTILNAPIPEGVHSPLWVAGSYDGRIAYSTDGTNWTENSPANIGRFNDLTFGKNSNGDDTWYGCSNSSAYGFSFTTDVTDINSWTAVDPPGNYEGIAIEYGANGTIMMGREFDVAPFRRSTDYGVTWVNSTVVGGTSSTKETSSLATDGNGIWVAGMGGLGNVFKSYDDGVTWYKSTDLSSDNSTGLEYANGVWVATAGDAGAISICTAIGQNTGTDTWTRIDIPGNNNPDGITYVDGGVWLAAGQNGTVWKSVDNAATWIYATSIVGGAANSLASDGINVIATDGSGNVHMTTDHGATWTTVHTITGSNSFRSIEYNKVKPF